MNVKGMYVIVWHVLVCLWMYERLISKITLKVHDEFYLYFEY